MYVMQLVSGGFTANFVTKAYAIGEICDVQFAVQGLTAGTVTFQYRNSEDDSWYTLDASELVFTSDAVKKATLGSVEVRAVGDGSVAGSSLQVLIAGRFVTEPFSQV